MLRTWSVTPGYPRARTVASLPGSAWAICTAGDDSPGADSRARSASAQVCLTVAFCDWPPTSRSGITQGVDLDRRRSALDHVVVGHHQAGATTAKPLPVSSATSSPNASSRDGDDPDDRAVRHCVQRVRCIGRSLRTCAAAQRQRGRERQAGQCNSRGDPSHRYRNPTVPEDRAQDRAQPNIIAMSVESVNAGPPRRWRAAQPIAGSLRLDRRYGRGSWPRPVKSVALSGRPPPAR